ncbi:rhodanese-related sulfurtransferase [Pseudomonas duriflava]|uniref:Rhodanese-related sulfurtransferase n=1 Tax=Pseudomonas duriflava TaxID=459528 RepID=A0A562QIM4_9PSED|nr:rhodanese-like domain-containing protein [Pseudomonas duriflava]TWI56618.1 rhodanese-related sulfurtransferase [Pseudomonas duriflava]
MQFVSRLIEFATNHYLLAGAFVVLLVLLLLNETRRSGRNLSTAELTRLLNTDQGIVLDIRPKKEFANGHIVGALNIPQDKLANSLSQLEKHKGKTIIVVDGNGQHAGAACTPLQQAGFTTARLSGGLSTWRGENLPLVKG